MKRPTELKLRTLRDARDEEKAARDARQVKKLARRRAKHNGRNHLPSARAKDNDPDMVDEPEVEVRAPVICPGVTGHLCGRLVSPRMMRDVSGFPTKLVGGAGHICDACVEWLFHTAKLTRSEAAKHHGAPKAYQTWLEARDQASGRHR